MARCHPLCFFFFLHAILPDYGLWHFAVKLSVWIAKYKIYYVALKKGQVSKEM